MDSINEFLDMGGYAAFVWPSYLIVAGVMAALWLASRRRLKQTAEDLARLEEGESGARP